MLHVLHGADATAYIFVVRERFRRVARSVLVLQVHQGCPVHIQEVIVAHFSKRHPAN